MRPAVELHVDALEDEPLRIAGDVQHAFHAENVLSFVAEQYRDPLVEFLRVQRARLQNADGRHGLVVGVIVGFIVLIVVLGVVAVVVMVGVCRVAAIVVVAVVHDPERDGFWLRQKIGFELQDPVEVEALHVEHGVHADDAVRRPVNFRGRVHPVDLRFERVEFGGAREVALVQQHHVGEGDLLADFAAVPVQGRVLGVDQRDDTIERGFRLKFVVGEKRLGNRAGVGEAGGFDQDVIELIAAFHQGAEDADEVAADGAANAAVVHLEYFFLGADHELLIDADLAEFVLDHGDPLAVVRRENVVEERGFAGAEKSGEDGDGDAGVSIRGHKWLRGRCPDSIAKQQHPGGNPGCCLRFGSAYFLRCGPGT